MSASAFSVDGGRPLAGRVAWVTGSGRNIGRAITLAFAAAGADVVVHGRAARDEVAKVAEEARACDVKALEFMADVRDESAVRELVAAAGEALGPIDLLVNNAAVRIEIPFEEMSYQEWHEPISIVLDGAYVCTRAVIPGMLERDFGTIINIAGMTGQSGARTRAHVVASKAGLIGFTKALALEYGPRGITVNAVSPGVIDTVRGPSAGGGVPHDRSRRVIAVGRLGQPEEVASLCLYLATTPARYITGQVLAVNGGAYI